MNISFYVPIGVMARNVESVFMSWHHHVQKWYACVSNISEHFTSVFSWAASLYQMNHYIDVIMSATPSQVPSITIVYSIVYSGADQRKHQSSASLASVTGEFPAQRTSNVENVSIWWRHHNSAVAVSIHQQNVSHADSYVYPSVWFIYDMID